MNLTTVSVAAPEHPVVHHYKRKEAGIPILFGRQQVWQKQVYR